MTVTLMMVKWKTFLLMNLEVIHLQQVYNAAQKSQEHSPRCFANLFCTALFLLSYVTNVMHL
jgi:hypothetical protein